MKISEFGNDALVERVARIIHPREPTAEMASVWLARVREEPNGFEELLMWARDTRDDDPAFFRLRADERADLERFLDLAKEVQR